MGKKDKSRNVPIQTVEKKTSLIDKLKFMQKSRKPSDKKQQTNNIVSATPINIQTEKAVLLTNRTNLPVFFMNVQNLVVKNANKNTTNSNNTQHQLNNSSTKQQNKQTDKSNEQKQVQYETWQNDKKEAKDNEKKSTQNIDNSIQQQRRYNFT